MSNAGTNQVTGDLVEDLRAYDSLPPDLRAVLQVARNKYSAVEVQGMRIWYDDDEIVEMIKQADR